jgi:hypothetical protein
MRVILVGKCDLISCLGYCEQWHVLVKFVTDGLKTFFVYSKILTSTVSVYRPVFDLHIFLVYLVFIRQLRIKIFNAVIYLSFAEVFDHLQCSP